MTVRELLSEEGKWTQEFSARDANGEFVPPWSPRAACWCLVGAVSRCYELGAERNDAWERLAAALPANVLAFEFNDDPKTTFADIRRVIEQAQI